MRKLAMCTLGLLLGYLAGALLGAASVDLLSPNTHDKGQEIAMTAAFVTGPIGAVIGLIIGWRRGRSGAN